MLYILAWQELSKGAVLVERNQVRFAGREVKVPRTRDESCGHDPSSGAHNS
jgi:hypothetical protein